MLIWCLVEGPLCILNLKIQFFYLVVLSIFTLILSALLVELSLVRKEIFKCVAVVTVSYRLVNISLLRFKDNYFLMHISDDGISIYMLRSMCVYCLNVFCLPFVSETKVLRAKARKELLPFSTWRGVLLLKKVG